MGQRIRPSYASATRLHTKGYATGGRLVVDGGSAGGANIGRPGKSRGVVAWARYLHGDLIGSTMLTTDESGAAVSAVSYTAFGELVTQWLDGQGQLHCQVGSELPAGFPRYGYAGSWGYETGGLPTAGGPPGSDPNRGIIALYGPDPDLPPITLMHVGYRWYDPALGRFIQRDPIGLSGGLNVYSYCGAEALTRIDPDGRLFWAVVIAAAVVFTLAEGYIWWQAGEAVACQPRPDPTADPESGCDPRNDGRMRECVRFLEASMKLPGTSVTGPPPSSPEDAAADLIRRAIERGLLY